MSAGEPTAANPLSQERVTGIKHRLLDCRAITTLRLGELNGLAYFVAELVDSEIARAKSEWENPAERADS
jgi:hypothetical protein